MADDKPIPVVWPVVWQRVGDRWFWATSSTSTNSSIVVTVGRNSIGS